LTDMVGCVLEAYSMPERDAGGNEGDETRGMVPRERCSPTRV